MTKVSPINSRPLVFCLGGGIEGLPIIKQVNKLGFTPVVLDMSRYAPGFAWAQKNPSKAMAWQADVYNPASVDRAVSRTYKGSWLSSQPIGAICCAIDAPDSQAILAKRFNLPSVGTVAAELGRDKWKQVIALHHAGLPVPNTMLVDIATPEKDVVGYYNIVKPQVGRGSRGVSRFTPDNYKERLIKALVECPQNNKKAIVQQWIDGQQLSTESVIRNGKVEFTAVALRNYSRLEEFHPHIIEDGIDGPFYLSQQHTDNLNILIRNACRALGWNDCTVKGDLVFSNGAFFIIELAERLSGGFFCTHSIPEMYDYDIVRVAIRLATGTQFANRDMRHSHAVCQRFVFPKPEWIGKKIVLFPPEPTDSNISHFTIYKRVGDMIQPVTNHATRLAQCIVFANTSTQAREKCERIIAEFREGIVVE